MQRKAKRRARQRPRHNIANRNEIVLTPIRVAVAALIEPRLNGGWRWQCPSMTEVMGRLSGGRATKHLVRRWLNGTRRAPAWFIDVLDSELQRQCDDRQAIREKLAELRLEAGDRRRGPLAAARMRALILAGKIGPGASKRMGEATGSEEAPKNEPHN